MSKSFEEVYVDGIEEINLNNNVVTIDFMTIQPSGDPQNPEREKKATISFTFDKFMDAYYKLGQLGGVMAEKGIIGIKKQEENGKGLADFKKPN